MNSENLAKLNTPATGEYTRRQTVALMALRGLTYSTYSDLNKFPTLKDVNQAFVDIVYRIGSIYEVLLDNMHGLEKYGTLEGLENYAQINTVALMALENTIIREKSLNPHTDHEDGILALELLLYDISAIDDMLSDNMEILWEIKDKARLAA